MTAEFRQFTFEVLYPRVSELKNGKFVLEKRYGATLESAENLDRDHSDYTESAHHYYTVYESSDGYKRNDALIGLSQQLINLGKFAEARRYLGILQDKVSNVGSDYYFAVVAEKLGIISDSEGNYESSHVYFNHAKRFITKINKDTWTEKEGKVHSTAIHYLGRANFGLGNYHIAVRDFTNHLEIEGLADDEKGYGHAWLARCFTRLNNFEKSKEEIEKAEIEFKKYIDKVPDKKELMAHLSLVKGEYYFWRGDFVHARRNFLASLIIRYKNEKPYAKGEAAAFYGIAATYRSEGKIGSAFVYGLKGLRTYPVSIIKPLL